MHPYTLRCDDLPPFARSTDEALRALFLDAGVDGIFTDFPDVCSAWLRRHASAESSGRSQIAPGALAPEGGPLEPVARQPLFDSDDHVDRQAEKDDQAPHAAAE